MRGLPLDVLDRHVRQHVVQSQVLNRRRLGAEKLVGNRIDQTDAAIRSAHHHAGLQALDDEFVHLRQVGQIDAAFLGQRFGSTQALGQGVTDQGGGEQAHAQQPGLRITLQDLSFRGGRVGQDAPGVFDQHGQGGDRGVENSDAPAEHEARTGDRDQQHQFGAAADAAAGVQQHGQQGDIGEAEHDGLAFEIRFVDADGPGGGEADREIGQSGVQEQVG